MFNCLLSSPPSIFRLRQLLGPLLSSLFPPPFFSSSLQNFSAFVFLQFSAYSAFAHAGVSIKPKSMDAATPRLQSTLLASTPRRRGPPPSLRIDTPTHSPDIALVVSESSASVSTLSSATSDTDSFIFPPPSKPRSSRNMKKLSLTLPSAQSSTNSLAIPVPESQGAESRRRLSVISLPAATTSTLLRRKGEEDENSDPAPYLDGPVQILPGVWLGSEDNVRDWKGLMERGIRSVLNVAKEVSTVFDLAPKPLRPFMSTPDLKAAASGSDSTYYPAHVSSGRPGMHYLKLPWSHGQADLVHEGFPAAMAFVDQALERGDGVLIQCVSHVFTFATAVSIIF